MMLTSGFSPRAAASNLVNSLGALASGVRRRMIRVLGLVGGADATPEAFGRFTLSRILPLFSGGASLVVVWLPPWLPPWLLRGARTGSLTG